MPWRRSGGDKFGGIEWRSGTTGAPILAGVVGYVDCDLEAEHDAGDHTIAVGRVRDFQIVEAASDPLLFFRGQYGSFGMFGLAERLEWVLRARFGRNDALHSQRMRRIEIVGHRLEWADQYAEIAARLRRSSGRNIVRIDHIGSTSVPGLAAKDVIDIQVTVRSLNSPEHVRSFESAGFRRKSDIISDALTGLDPDSVELRKQYFREPEGERRAHIHVREDGRLNQRYALLFRDYLRSDAAARQSYEIVKRRLADLFPNDIDGYLSVKDPVMDLIYRGAEQWAVVQDWRPGEDHH